ncbi:MAG: tryptophan 7-halogenase [Solirubrobacteraceae bacterium]
MSIERGQSIVEFAAVRPPREHYDVAILGGGLAGLTLAIQLKQTRPQTSVVVLEKREGPAPLAAFKVGESTVPSGAHYFAEVVGMKEHLVAEQVRKCGLRYFPTADGNEDITKRVEMGPPIYPPHDNFQLDRGLFENKLAARARSLGVDIQQGARVREIELGGDRHRVTFEQFDEETALTARWIVDAAGRASIMKRKLDLATDCGHHINSAWFRLGGGLDFEEWGAGDAAWMGRMSEPGIRRYSTNHLMGEGYWVWLIQLATGPISIGLCADPRFHPYEEINELDRLLGWLRKHEPQLAASVEQRQEDIEDFLRVRDFAYGVKQAFSTDRWALVGEAAAFADPFYSPGSDFIGYSNTFTADLVTRDLDGEEIDERARYCNELYQRLFEHVISRYRDSYPVFGNPWVMCGFLTWDFYINHVGAVLLFTQNRLTDLDFMKRADEDMERLFKLNINMHKLFREWHELERKPRDPDMLATFPVLVSGLVGLVKEYPDDEALLEELRTQVRNAEAMAVAIFNQAAKALPEGGPPTDRPLNPYALSLDPQRWEADGLFEAPGIAIEQARAAIVGLDGLWDSSLALAGGPPPGVGGGPPPGVAGGPPPGVAGGSPPGAGGPPAGVAG